MVLVLVLFLPFIINISMYQARKLREANEAYVNIKDHVKDT